MGLRIRSIDVLTAFEDHHDEADDPIVLDRASALGRILFSQDDDLLAEATHRQRQGIPFGAVVYAHQLHVSIGQCVHDLEFIAQAGEPSDLQGIVLYLPL